MTAYYNEIEPYAADWLENLIAEGHIAPGIVDRRDIRDIVPSDLAGFTQCHFFAGIGVWSAALRGAGWPDDRPIWTGSCPCQPFSAAGAGAGFADERHLWPHWHWLIQECQPPVIAGEQVASKNVDPWVDLVHADMEALGYAFGCVPFPAAGIGAPHIRDRTYWMADRHGELHDGSRIIGTGWRSEDSDRHATGRLDHHHQGSQGHAGHGDSGGGWSGAARSASEASLSGGLSDTASGGRREERPLGEWRGPGDSPQGQPAGHSSSSSSPLRLVDADQPDSGEEREQRGRELGWLGGDQGAGATRNTRRIARPGPTNGSWGDADWLLCRDGKWRPVEPGTFPLAHGAVSRVGRLRAYGNAIVREAAQVFIEIYLEHEREGDFAVAGNGSLINGAFEAMIG